ncbi:MAG: hypothetical protein GX752_01385 [Clostridium sp.]|nr:hypothetical protein [Clostridium sp.]
MNWSVFLILLLMFVGVFVLYTFLNISYLSKIKVNQWLILAIAVVFVLASLIVPNYTSNKILTNISIGIFFFFFLWFLDARKADNIRKRNRETTRVIKPKANPNRVKQFKDEDIIKTEDISKKGKKKRKK